MNSKERENYHSNTGGDDVHSKTGAWYTGGKKSDWTITGARPRIDAN